MKEIFSEYGKAVIAAVTALAMIGLCSLVILHGDAWKQMLDIWVQGGVAKEVMLDSDRLTEVLAENALHAEYLASVNQLEVVDANSQITVWDSNQNEIAVTGIPRDPVNYEEPGIYELFFSYEKPNHRTDYGSVKFPVQRKKGTT